MNRTNSRLIDFVESVYDLESADAAWIPNLLQVGLPILDRGLGLAAASYTRDPSSPAFMMHQKFAISGPPDLAARIDRAISEWPRDVYRELLRPGLVGTLSKIAADHPECLEAYERHIEGVRDVFGITAVDPNGLGILLIVFLPRLTTLNGEERELWKMVGAHLAAGHRLRRALVAAHGGTELPRAAEAVIDPISGRLTDATGPARNEKSVQALREAAVQIDRARGKTRKSDPAAAVEMWKGLTLGRWSLVDWFDSDERRFMLAVPNMPDVSDPRGLSNRESLVTTYAMSGDSIKLISYRLGVSQASISTALQAAMRKLGVKTRAQLIERFSSFS